MTAETATVADNTISVLNGLIQTCKDGADGFQDAADNVKTMRDAQ